MAKGLIFRVSKYVFGGRIPVPDPKIRIPFNDPKGGLLHMQ